MLRSIAECPAPVRALLRANSRPWVRYRKETFGYLAAFPDGNVAILDSAARPDLESGAGFEACRRHMLGRMTIEQGFHFSAPLMAWLEVTRRCNLRCPHCFVEAGAPRSTELSTDRILELLDEWAEMGVFCVVITGGEPTLHRDFLTIVRHAWDAGFVVSIATNGMTLTDRLLDQIPQDDVLISVSLDGIHGQGAASASSDFAYVTDRLLRLRRRGFNASIMTTTTRDNVNDLQTIIDWAVANDVSLRSVPFVPMGRGRSHTELLNATGDVELAARFWLAEEQWERVKDRRLGLCAGKIFNFLLTMVFATRRCMSGRGLCYVNSAGDVYPCSNCSGAKVLAGGNLFMSRFRDVWECPEWPIRQITWDNFRAACEHCPINHDKYFCTGRCPGSSAILNGTFHDCGATEFQRQSVLRREELFREHVRPEPRVPVAAEGAC